MQAVTVIGGGLAGCEAALQLSARGIAVQLVEMRPDVCTPAHRGGQLAELVCSNSLKSEHAETASGLLKREMELLGCRLLQIAAHCRVPAGHALAVDRELFAAEVSRAIEDEVLIEVRRSEQTDLETAGCAIVATGPLTSGRLCAAIESHLGEGCLYFYDAISISVDAQSIIREAAFRASRYGKGGDDYWNIPLEREEYSRLVAFLLTAPTVEPRGFESSRCFEACLPVEVIASRGEDALRFGPLKPRGLVDPRTGRQPYAVLQLRQEKRDGSLLGLVGFQTRLAQGAQRQLLHLIPGLEEAEIVRWGAIHRNTYLDAPRHLDARQMSRRREGLFFAGQLAGVEGYVESIAHGLLTAINAAAWLRGIEAPLLPADTMTGALQHYLGSCSGSFQPMNANFGLLPPERGTRRRRRMAQAGRALESLGAFMESGRNPLRP